MTTPANLPQTRPTSDLYGPDLIDDEPVTDPETSISAAAWNPMRGDLAFLGSVTPLAIIRVHNNGSATSVLFARGIDPANVTVTRLSAGAVQVDVTAASIQVGDAHASARVASSASECCSTIVFSSATVIVVKLAQTGGGTAVDTDFTVWIY